MPRGHRHAGRPRPPATTAVPRPRWSRFTTALATLAAVAVVLTGGATAAHADPGRRDRAADRRGLEQARTDHRAAQRHPDRPRRQAQAGRRAGQADRPAASARSTQAMDKVSGARRPGVQGREHVRPSTPCSAATHPSQVVEQLELLDRFASRQQRTCGPSPTCATNWPRQKAPLDEMVAQLARTEAQLAAKKKQINAEIDRLQKLRLKVYGNGGGGPLRPAPCPAGYPGGAAGTAVKFACAQIGKPYVWGAEGPNSYDCSGLTHGRLGEGRGVAAAQRRRSSARSPTGSAGPTCAPATWSSTTATCTTSACTSATAGSCTPPRPVNRSR